MATDYKKHMTTELLSDQHIVSYRTLARAVKVHVNAAKCMLYDFYTEQSRRKPGSVYATYLLAGVKKDEKPQTNGMTNGISHDEDDEIPPPSSPPPFTSSMLDPSQQNGDDHQEQHVLRKTITLVREENLEEVKAAYETISSIHIYSLSPGKMPDLTALTDLGRSLYADVFAKEDPLTHNKTYGVIQNPQVRRRKGKRPVIPSAPAPKFQPVKDEKVASKASVRPATSNIKKEDTASRPSSRDSTAAPPAKQPTLKRGGSSISDAFAKTKEKKASSQLKQEDDVKMTDEDDGEEDDAMFLDTGTMTTKTTKKRTSEAKQERENKAAKLRKMMDSDDEAEVPKVEDAPDSEINKEPAMPAPEAKGDEDEVAWSASEDEKEQTAEDSGPKRRRGKRKIMKKKTAKDEDGFLVTREEEVWESFSESDHEDMRKPVVQRNAKATNQGSQKISAKGGTQGKKDIMSFFGRKK